MFRRFLNDKEIFKYRFRSDIFPSVNDRDFWDAFDNFSCIQEAQKELDYAWPPIKATDFMEYKKSK